MLLGHKIILYFTCCKLCYGTNINDGEIHKYEKAFGHMRAASEKRELKSDEKIAGKKAAEKMALRSGSQLNNFIRGMQGYAYPGTIPTPREEYYNGGPFETIYQGQRKDGDKKVFGKKFDHPSITLYGQRVVYEKILQCEITHIAAETTGGVPILLRGGVGYHYFTILAKAYPGKKLTGRVRVYCDGDVVSEDKNSKQVQDSTTKTPMKKEKPSSGEKDGRRRLKLKGHKKFVP